MNLRLTSLKIDGDNYWGNGFLEIDSPPWNGWAKPWFTREQITNYLRINGWSFSFDGETLVIDFEDVQERYMPLGPSEMYGLDGLEWVEAK